MTNDPDLASLLSNGYELLCSSNDSTLNGTTRRFLDQGRHTTKIFGKHLGIKCNEYKATDFDVPWVTITLKESKSIRLTSAIERFLNSKFGEHYYTQHPVLEEWNDLLKAAKELPDSNPTPWHWEVLARIITRCEPHNLLRCLEEIAFPIFFTWNPNGKIQIYLQDFKSERYFSEMRILRIATSLNLEQNIKSQTIPSSLDLWQSSNPLSMFEMILDWSGTITYPVMQNFVIGPLGLTLNFIDDELAINTPPNYPDSFTDIKYSKSSFGVFAPPLKISKSQIHADPQTYHGRCVWAEELDQAHILQAWVAEKAHVLISNLTNLNLYAKTAIFNKSGIDLGFPFEKTATLDRAFRRCLWLNTVNPRSASRMPVFEIADALAALRNRWCPGEQERVIFKKFFDVKFCETNLTPVLSSLPDPWGNRLCESAKFAYEDINRSVLNSIWDKKRIHGKSVDISPKNDSSELIDGYQFTTSVIRDLRNTHHGYQPNKQFPEIRRRLSLVSGILSPEIALLPSLWLLALLEDPNAVIGWKC